MSEDVQYVTLEEVENSTASDPMSASQVDQATWPELVPLVRPLPAPAPFPVEALGPVLGNAASAISDIVQCPSIWQNPCRSSRPPPPTDRRVGEAGSATVLRHGPCGINLPISALNSLGA